jgi:hypothetical protein
MKTTAKVAAIVLVALLVSSCKSLKPFTQDEIDRLSSTHTEVAAG